MPAYESGHMEIRGERMRKWERWGREGDTQKEKDTDTHRETERDRETEA